MLSRMSRIGVVFLLISIPLNDTAATCNEQSLATLRAPSGTRYTPQPDIPSYFPPLPAGIGDINNDGFADFAFCNHRAHQDGECHVIFGRSLFPDTISNTLDGNNGFVVKGGDANISFGDHISGLGDVNGDGIDDFAISSYSSPLAAIEAGRVYLVYGSAAGYPALVDVSVPSALSSEFSTPPDTLHGAPPVVAKLGDIDGDGHADFAVSVPSASTTHLVFGQNSSFAHYVDLATHANAVRIHSHVTDHLDFLGASIAGGDFNGDGLTDIAISAPYYRDHEAQVQLPGRVYIFHGRPIFPHTLSTAPIDAFDGIIVHSTEFHRRWLGLILRNAGDINQDGIDDLMIDSISTTASLDPRLHVLFGNSAAAGTVDLHQPSTFGGFSVAGTSDSIFAADGVGDVNLDGIDDLVISDWRRATPSGLLSAGRVFVLFGRNSPFPGELRLYTLPSDWSVQLYGEGAYFEAGMYVRGAGDINGDGASDILISSQGPTRPGIGYVRFGNDRVLHDGFEQCGENDQSWP